MARFATDQGRDPIELLAIARKEVRIVDPKAQTTRMLTDWAVSILSLIATATIVVWKVV